MTSLQLTDIPPHPVLHKKQAVVPIKQLFLNKTQLSQIESIYRDKKEYIVEYSESNAHHQQEASQVLQDLLLDRPSRESLDSRWTIRWSTKSKGKGKKWQRTLFQWYVGSKTIWTCIRPLTIISKCGYDERVRQERDAPANTGERQVPYDFTECMAHVEVSEYVDSRVVRRIVGMLEHNEKCEAAKMVRLPSVPLHEDVYEMALAQLNEGASMAAVQARNQQMLAERAYLSLQGQSPFNKSANCRYNIDTKDFQTIYRKFTRSRGVDITMKPEQNLDNWLNESSPFYKPELKSAIFKYAPRFDSGSRLVVCIATSDMDEAAWKYTHKKQLLLDGTFGVVSSRMLLFIPMGVDENSKGLPLAFFLFSAPGGTKATHGAYDTTIIRDLLTRWRDHLGVRNREAFEPYVAITDCDTRERSALLAVWPSIWLLLCKFHLRQCWTSKRKSLLKGTTFWKEHVQRCILNLEQRLLESDTHDIAVQSIAHETSYLQSTINDASTSADMKNLSRKAITYLEYLSAQWMHVDMWTSWSQKGRSLASVRIGVPLESIVPTTNHLESFNFVLKHKFINQRKHSGQRLRFDIFIHLLVKEIIPEVYYRRYVYRMAARAFLRELRRRGLGES
ncbi:hypothetical protein SCHPADRAFT_830505 [Schizopora paradoxa]|uniref:MULE transposase domain-containing protein n=1 Tax=Schizopora paradoxa TaxID=27342 RepID=A0A0H2RQL2_9AGAM|nr:hypothetical protein SCHPADRAFT_830505 [Schizopora paradoxa]